MRILAFDTATRATTVALVDIGTDESIVAEARDDPAPGLRPRHTTHLMRLIADVLDRGDGWETVDRIAVGVGPGTFTGLRIGVASARALARARNLPLAGVSTLESLALGAAAAGTGYDAVLPMIDARRGEVFAAAWAPGAFAAAWAPGAPTPPAVPAPLLDPSAIAPAALADAGLELGPRRLAVGDGAVEFRAVLEASGATVPDRDSSLHRVDAAFHARLATGPAPGPGADVRPEYLRLPDAELSLRAAQKR